MKTLMFKPYFYPISVSDEMLEKIWHRTAKNGQQEKPRCGKIVLVVYSDGRSEILRWTKESEEGCLSAFKQWAYVEELI